MTTVQKKKKMVKIMISGLPQREKLEVML